MVGVEVELNSIRISNSNLSWRIPLVLTADCVAYLRLKNTLLFIEFSCDIKGTSSRMLKLELEPFFPFINSKLGRIPPGVLFYIGLELSF